MENGKKNYVENRIYNFLKNVAGNNNLLEKMRYAIIVILMVINLN